ncbi:MAG: hypothetical protein ACQEW9_18130 [Bacteroidota bacterium]|uniref:Uncharacterized protein n=1 Tax=Algoriphagus faecimaris TaxID=686796 RepID=A0A1G6VHT5_9BACT|nr:hypothetical protein [Algoriphagus faecimaris]SDD52943.1 hypothetical protein SAMN04488104_103532 [Algoriphagus faecimaris]
MKISQKNMLDYFLPKVEREGKKFKKKTLIKAKSTQAGLEIVTKTSDGIESKNVSEEGDYLVENQTSTGEKYLVRKKMFERKYEIKQALSEGWAVYAPKDFIWAVQLSSGDLTHFGQTDILDFMAPWDELIIAKAFDYLVLPPEKDEIYRIAKKEFEETYQEI